MNDTRIVELLLYLLIIVVCGGFYAVCFNLDKLIRELQEYESDEYEDDDDNDESTTPK